MNYKTLLITTLLAVVSLALLALVVKGRPSLSGTLTYQYEYDTQVGGPFESSNSTSRFALVEAIVEKGSFFLSEAQARFATPDLARVGTKYISIFTPGVSFFALPFYVLGSILEMPQLVTYGSTMFLAFINATLVLMLARRLGASSASSYVAGFLFLFATNALPYALTLTQHHATVTLLLLAFLGVAKPPTFLRNILLGALFGAGLLVDIPNGLILLPVILYALSGHIMRNETGDKVIFQVKLSVIGMLIGLLPLLSLFAWYNYKTTGNYFLIGQTVGRYNYPEQQSVEQASVPDSIEIKQLRLPYQTRNLLEGFYVLLISDERGWVYYSPIILFGLLGFACIYLGKQQKGLAVTAIASIGVTFLSYAMFADPWGGWSFGPRYLLPATALVCAGIAVAVDKYRSNIVFGILLVAASIYSISVNVLGALTTNAIPPKVEAVNLLEPIPYTYTYNLDFLLNKNASSSLVYNLWLGDYLSAFQYFLLVTIAAASVFLILYITSVVALRKKA